MYQALSKLQKQTQNAALCIIVKTRGSTPRKVGTKMVVLKDGTISGTIGGGSFEKKVIEQAKECIENNNPQLYQYQLKEDFNMECGGTIDVFIDLIKPSSKLYIFGAGHVGKAIAEFAHKLNFEITIIDDRENIFNNFNNNDFNIINKHFSQAFEELIFDSSTYITSVSHTHDYDRDIIAYCAKQPVKYIGMLASSKKKAKMKKFYTDNQLLTKEQIDKIDMPMGININCQTPEEIAISILAKILDIRSS